MSVETKRVSKIYVPAQISTISMVVAIGLNREIGEKNVMPWSIPEDLQHFKAATIHNCVIMGRRTFESISRPLPARRNIVISSNTNLATQYDIEVASSLSEAISLAKQPPQKLIQAQAKHEEYELVSYSTIAIIGGARLFKEGLKIANVLDLTEIQATFPHADTYFPEFLDEHCHLQKVEPEQGYYVTEAKQPEGFEQRLAHGSEQLQYCYKLYRLDNNVD